VDARPAGVRAPRLTVAHIALLLPWVIAVIGARLPIRDNSFLWHVRAGTLQAGGGAVLTVDPFSFTRLGESWRTQSWLLELLYARLEGWFGLGFVPGLVASVAVATTLLVLISVYRMTQSIEATALIGVITAWLGAPFLNPRPVLVSYLLLAATFVAVSNRRLRWSLSLIAWVWASVHASFLLGIGLVVLEGLRTRRRERAVDAALMAAVATLTAHGWAVWEIVLEFFRSSDALDLMTEWATPNLISIEFGPYVLGLVLLLVGAIRGHLRARDLWVVVPFLAFGLTAQRAVYPAWIALAPFAALGLVDVRRAGAVTNRRLVRVIGLIILGMPFVIPVSGTTFQERFPVEAARHLTGERPFHDDVVGGYLIYSLGSDREVFVDDRAELFGASFLKDVVQTRNGTPRWSEVFDEWRIDQALVRTEDVLAHVLAGAGWSQSYRDEAFVVFDRP
jgi:hypothetical protein